MFTDFLGRKTNKKQRLHDVFIRDNNQNIIFFCSTVDDGLCDALRAGHRQTATERFRGARHERFKLHYRAL